MSRHKWASHMQPPLKQNLCLLAHCFKNKASKLFFFSEALRSLAIQIVAENGQRNHIDDCIHVHLEQKCQVKMIQRIQNSSCSEAYTYMPMIVLCVCMQVDVQLQHIRHDINGRVTSDFSLGC